ncbi:MAG: hypothetical protein ACRDCN_08175 [Tannerellaceae bacterium]
MRKLFMACAGCACLLIASSAMANDGQTKIGKGSEQDKQAKLMLIKALEKMGAKAEKAKKVVVMEYIAMYGFDQLPDNSLDNNNPDFNDDLLFPGIDVGDWENGGNIDIEF